MPQPLTAVTLSGNEPRSRSLMAADVRLMRMFVHLDTYANGSDTAVATASLSGARLLTVRAGGPGTLSGPLGGPFTHFEVLMDHEPPRFWTRYGHDVEGVLFACVPRLLISHYVISTGGIRHLEMAVRTLVFVDE